MNRSTTALVAVSLVALGGFSSTAAAQTVAPPFDADYELVDLGSVDGVPGPYGGITFRSGDPNILYLGGNANNANGTVYEVTIERGDDGGIIGFGCAEAIPFTAMPRIDGGLEFGPEGVLFATGYSNNVLMQVRPGSIEPDRTIELSPLGVASSTGTLRFVPNGIEGAGTLILASYNTSRFYRTTLTPDGEGTFDISTPVEIAQLSGGPEGLVFIPGGDPQIDVPSAIVSEYASNRVSVYALDADGVPDAKTRRDFVTGLGGAEGATIDPITGDYIFSTFGGGNRVIRVTGFDTPDICRPDLTGDGMVDGADLASMLGAWGGGPGSPADLDGNCSVDGEDLAQLLGAWGPCN